MYKRMTTALTVIAFVFLAATSGCAAGVSGRSAHPAASPSRSATGHHSLGFVPNEHAPTVPQVARSGSLPLEVNLSAFNPPVGDQDDESPLGGSMGDDSCTSWATGYYLRGWYAKRDGYYPTQGFAPMYLYAQIVRGVDRGTTFAENLDIQKEQGIDASSDYLHGNLDFTTQPTDTERTNAARYKIARYEDYSEGQDRSSEALYGWIQEELASGNPVVIGVAVYDEFLNATASTSYIEAPTHATTFHGYHAVFVYGYDIHGLLIENSWGTGWGNGGFAELDHFYALNNIKEAIAVTPQLPPFSWQRLPGTATDIGVGADGAVWAIGATPVYGGFTILHWNPSTWTWTAVDGGAVRIAVGPDGNPWVVNSFGNIFHWVGRWQSYPGLARDIGIGVDGSVWIVGRSSVLSNADPRIQASGHASLATPPGPGLDPNDGGIYRWNYNDWQQVPGGANRITVCGIFPWTVGSSGAITQRWGSDLHEQRLPGSATDIGCSNSATRNCWIVGTDQTSGSHDHDIYSWNGTNWDATAAATHHQMLSGTGGAVDISVGPAGNAWVVDGAQRIFELPEWQDL